MTRTALLATLALVACGRLPANGLNDSLRDVDLLVPQQPARDAGGEVGDAGLVVTPGACAPSAFEVFDAQHPPAPAPARLGGDFYRDANLNSRRLARAQTSEFSCPDEAWAWVSAGDVEGEELIVLSALQGGHRFATLTLPAQGVVRHLELIDDPQAGWVVAWVTENRGLFTAVVDLRLAPTLPQVLPSSVMDPVDPRPFELTYAFDRPLIITQRATPDRARNELVISTVPLARSSPPLEHHVELGPALDASWGPLPAPAALALGDALFVRTAFQVTRFSSPTQAVSAQGLAAAWHDASIVFLPPSPNFEGGPVVVAAGDGQGTRRYQYGASCFAENGGRCSFWVDLPGSTWGGSQVWNHAGVAAAACGRKLAVALRSFESIGDCANYGYCRAGDLHLVLAEPGVFPVFDRTLTPRDAPSDGGAFIGYDDQEVSSPIVFARHEPNRAWPVADVAWVQALADGGVELRLERSAADCSP